MWHKQKKYKHFPFLRLRYAYFTSGKLREMRKNSTFRHLFSPPSWFAQRMHMSLVWMPSCPYLHFCFCWSDKWEPGLNVFGGLVKSFCVCVKGGVFFFAVIRFSGGFVQIISISGETKLFCVCESAGSMRFAWIIHQTADLGTHHLIITAPWCPGRT